MEFRILKGDDIVVAANVSYLDNFEDYKNIIKTAWAVTVGFVGYEKERDATKVKNFFNEKMSNPKQMRMVQRRALEDGQSVIKTFDSDFILLIKK